MGCSGQQLPSKSLTVMDLNTSRVKEERVVTVSHGKAFHVFDRRNQWTDWSGNTAITRRPWGLLISLNEAEQWAESSRVQGTSFIIEELPVVCAKSNSGTLLLGERNSVRPMNGWRALLEHLDGVPTIGSLIDALASPQRDRLVQVTIGRLRDVTVTDGAYFSRQSSPGKGRNHLAWTLKLVQIDDTSVLQVATYLTQMLREAGSVQ